MTKNELIAHLQNIEGDPLICTDDTEIGLYAIGAPQIRVVDQRIKKELTTYPTEGNMVEPLCPVEVGEKIILL